MFLSFIKKIIIIIEMQLLENIGFKLKEEEKLIRLYKD